MDHGEFCWNELMTDNVEAAKAFYEKAVGWSFEEMPMPGPGSYWVAVVDGEAVAGLMGMDGLPEGTPTGWFAYLEVDDVDARATAVKEAGGQVLRDPFDIEGVGRIAVIADATGGRLGIMTSSDEDDEDDDDDDD